MAEDGYEVMGPGGAKPVPAPAPLAIAPPAPPAALESQQEKTAPKSAVTKSEASVVSKKKSKKKREKEEQTVGDGTGVNQRPNSCDTILLALTCVILILVTATSIPMILAAFDAVDIESLKSSMENVE